MACQSCRQHARLLARTLRPASSELPAASRSSTTPYPRPSRTQAQPQTQSRRQFGTTSWRQVAAEPKRASKTAATDPRPTAEGNRIDPDPGHVSTGSAVKNIAVGLPKFAPQLGSQYLLTNQLDKLYKVCAAPAAYSIPEEQRLKDEVPKTEDGEELGIPEGQWLHTFSSSLSPSFSSWSHVTMLHMYLIVARMRCLDRDAARSTQAQFIDNFFFDCERVMHVNHGMTSSALRQRYLKDIFMQWRGLIAAYDEGIAKSSDRVLAAAVWRNLFKAREDVDFRHLAAIVAWMRATLCDLENMHVEDVVAKADQVFRRDPRALLKLVDEPSQGVGELLGRAMAAPNAKKAAPAATGR